jgi:3-(methylthio)propanoyl-CoA dehydrogenase
VTELLDEIRTYTDHLPKHLASVLGDAVETADTTSTWLRTTMATSPRDAMAGATPYLRLLATTVGGWLMARQYVAAPGNDDASIARRATAEFFLTQLLPPAVALAGQVTAGVGVFDAVSDAALASS